MLPSLLGSGTHQTSLENLPQETIVLSHQDQRYFLTLLRQLELNFVCHPNGRRLQAYLLRTQSQI